GRTEGVERKERLWPAGDSRASRAAWRPARGGARRARLSGAGVGAELVRVLVADGQALVREGLVALRGPGEGIGGVGAGADGGGGRRRCRAGRRPQRGGGGEAPRAAAGGGGGAPPPHPRRGPTCADTGAHDIRRRRFRSRRSAGRGARLLDKGLQR